MPRLLLHLRREALNYLCSVFVDYYHRFRPHQGKDNELLIPSPAPPKSDVATADGGAGEPPVCDATIRLSDIRCEEQLGGLLKHYYRKAA